MTNSLGQTILYLSIISEVNYSPIPTLITRNNSVVLLLLLALMVSTILFTRNRKVLLHKANKLMSSSSRSLSQANISIYPTGILKLFIPILALLIGVSGFALISGLNNDSLTKYTTYQSIGFISLLTLLYFLLKFMLYKFLGWVFWTKKESSSWASFYSSLLYITALISSPLLFLLLFINLTLTQLIIIQLCLLGVIKMTQLYRLLTLFSTDIYGLLRLFLYFCALEIIPLLLIYKSLISFI